MILSLLLSCTRADPELQRLSEAAALWDQGREQLSAGRPDEAAATFERASEVAPSPLLDAWRAQALARAGRLDEAISLLGAVLAARPTFAEARYNRAAYLARQNRLPEAAEELKVALADGAQKPLLVLEDPDFAPHLDKPELSFLPKQTLSVSSVPPEGTAFYSAEIRLAFAIEGPLKEPLQIESGPVLGPVALSGVIEERTETDSGAAVRLEYRYRALGAGAAEFGPVSFRSGSLQAAADAARVVISAPEDRGAPAVAPDVLPLPSALAAKIPLGTAALAGGSLVAHVSPGDRVLTEPELGPAARCEILEGKEVKDLLLRYPPGLSVARVRVVGRDGSPRFDGVPPVL